VATGVPTFRCLDAAKIRPRALLKAILPCENPEPRPFDMDTVMSEVKRRLAAYGDPCEVSVLGSAAKGIGEAREFEFGITAANDSGIIYAKGRPSKKVPTEGLVAELFREIDKHYAAGRTVVVDDAQAAEAVRWLSETEDETTI
jgi:(E)-4-hydroxy-3-methylbut-2-enyl-diphosphate synthase